MWCPIAVCRAARPGQMQRDSHISPIGSGLNRRAARGGATPGPWAPSKDEAKDRRTGAGDGDTMMRSMRGGLAGLLLFLAFALAGAGTLPPARAQQTGARRRQASRRWMRRPPNSRPSASRPTATRASTSRRICATAPWRWARRPTRPWGSSSRSSPPSTRASPNSARRATRRRRRQGAARRPRPAARRHRFRDQARAARRADAKETIDRMIREINEAFSRDNVSSRWPRPSRRCSGPRWATGWPTTSRGPATSGATGATRFPIPAPPRGSARWRLAGAGAAPRPAAAPASARLRPADRRRAGAEHAGAPLGARPLVRGGGHAHGRARRVDLLLRPRLGGRPDARRAPAGGIARPDRRAGAFVLSLGAGLLLVGQPSWRLLPLDEAAAQRLRPFPGLAALLTFLGVLLVEGGRPSVSASRPPSSSTTSSPRLWRPDRRRAPDARRLRRAHPDAASRQPSARTTLVTLATLLAWACVAAGLVAALQGYVNLALFLTRQVIWTAVVSASAFLLLVVVDDLCTTFLSGESRLGRSLHVGLGLRRAQVGQLGVLLSALLRIAILVWAALLLSGPLGRGRQFALLPDRSSAEIQIGGSPSCRARSSRPPWCWRWASA